MVIEQSTIIGFYIASVAQIMMIALSLFFLHRKHPFRMTAVVVGVAVYFLASQLLTSICYSALTSIPAVQSFLSNPDHVIIYYLILAVLTALFMAPVTYFILKFVRKGNWNIYEAMAAGISYWLYNSITSSMNYINQARISEMANKNELSSLISDQISQADIDAYVELLQNASLSQCLAQILFFAVVLLMSTLIFMLVYHGMKRKNFLFVALAAGIHFVVIFTTYLGTLADLWIYCLIILAAGILLSLGIYFYFKWYRSQQQILRQQRLEFKARKAQAYQEKIAQKEAAARESTLSETPNIMDSDIADDLTQDDIWDSEDPTDSTSTDSVPDEKKDL